MQLYGAAQKSRLVPSPAGVTGGRVIVFNNSDGSHNLEVTVLLKGAAANTRYDIYLFVDVGCFNGTPVAIIETNKAGNANFYLDATLLSGMHWLVVDVTLQGSLADVYATPGIPNSVQMNFK